MRKASGRTNVTVAAASGRRWPQIPAAGSRRYGSLPSAARGRRRMLTGFAIVLSVLGVAGCRSEEPPLNPAATPSAPTTAPTTQPTSEPTSPIETAPAPVKRDLTPEERAAQEAFSAMTRDGVSQDELDDAMEKLLAIGAPAVPVLAEGLQADESIKREMAATMLASIGQAAAAARDGLIAALQDESAFVRANAATALAQMEGQTAVVLPVFAEFLGGEDENMRTMMATNFGVLDATDAQPLLGQLTDLLEHTDRDVQLAVVAFLGRMGTDAQAAVDDLNALDTTDDEELQAAVTAALMQIESAAE